MGLRLFTGAALQVCYSNFMNTTAIGSSIEQATVNFLQENGLTVIERNWRTKWCEIDIVARDAQGVVHIIEVRYRKSAASGDAVESVTPAKQRQLTHAAKRWLMWRGAPWGIQIDVVGVTGTGADSRFVYVENAVQEI